MDMGDGKDYVFASWPNDQLTRLSDRAVFYTTAPQRQGLGTEFGLTPTRQSILGLAILDGRLDGSDDGPNLINLAIRLDERERPLYPAIVVGQIAAMQPSPREPPVSEGATNVPLHEVTPRGLIATNATEQYRDAIQACERYVSPEGPYTQRFAACLKQQLRNAAADLEGVYSGTIAYLKSSPDQLARLRQSQRAWLSFQTQNCAFAKSLGPPGPNADVAAIDCDLRSTIERKVELRSMVGD
jgi:uncharacterized protein YecT (DUF1311 family)